MAECNFYIANARAGIDGRRAVAKRAGGSQPIIGNPHVDLAREGQTEPQRHGALELVLA
jgi:hypothetical protein